MGFLQKLAHTFGQAGDNISHSLPGEAVRAVNRNTPWGQANQQAYNAMHSPARQSALSALAVQPTPNNSIQLGGDEPYQVQDTQAGFNMHPQRSNIQQGSPYMLALPQGRFNQQQPQVGVTQYPIQQSYQSQTLPELPYPFLQHLGRL